MVSKTMETELNKIMEEAHATIDALQRKCATVQKLCIAAGGFVPDWKNYEQEKFYVRLDSASGELEWGCAYSYSHQGIVYFPEQDDQLIIDMRQELIELHGRVRIKCR